MLLSTPSPRRIARSSAVIGVSLFNISWFIILSPRFIVTHLGAKINTKIDMSLALGNKESVSVVVKRDGKKHSFNIKTTDIEGYKTLGIYLETLDKNLFNIIRFCLILGEISLFA